MLQWVGISFAVHVLATNLLWVVQEKYAARTQPVFNRAWWKVAALLVRVTYFVGVPYAALIGGFISPRLYALSDAVEFHAWGISLLLTTGVFALVGLSLWIHARTALSHYPSFVFPAAQRRAQLSQPWGASFVLLDTLCLQAHWAFYRAGLSAFFNEPLAGALGGLLLVLSEWLLDPAWRKHIRTPGQAEDLFLLLGLALLSTLLFILVNNFWFVLLTHTLLWLGWLVLMQHWYRPLAQYPAGFETGDA